MIDREKVISGLECCIKYPNDYGDCMGSNCPYGTNIECHKKLIQDAIVLLKAQELATVEPKRIELANETKAWLDRMDAADALNNIADICIDWDGYRTANGLGGLINEIWAYARYCADRLLKAQEPETVSAPKPDSDIGCWHNITHNYTLEKVVNALKAQEPVEPKMMEFVDEGLTWEKYEVPTCGVCGALLGDALFCPNCGQAVRWG